MSDFYENVILPGEAAEGFIQETGNLPEIEAAAGGLFAAITQTRKEITDATFASRFPTELTPYQRNMAGIFLKNPSPFLRQALEAEGEAGMKRSSLQTRLTEAELDVHRVIRKLVELRTDLIVSQQE